MRVLMPLVFAAIVTGCASPQAAPQLSPSAMVDRISGYTAEDEAAAEANFRADCARASADMDRLNDSMGRIDDELKKSVAANNPNDLGGVDVATVDAKRQAALVGASRPQCQKSIDAFKRILTVRDDAAKKVVDIMEAQRQSVPPQILCISNRVGSTVYTSCQ